MEACERGVDIVVGEQLAGGTGVLGRDNAHLAQHAQRSQGDVFEIADRRADQVEGAHFPPARRLVGLRRTPRTPGAQAARTARCLLACCIPTSIPTSATAAPVVSPSTTPIVNESG